MSERLLMRVHEWSLVETSQWSRRSDWRFVVLLWRPLDFIENKVAAASNE